MLVAGCSLFAPVDLAQQMTAQRSVLPPIKAPADAVQLQIVFIERPPDDPLVGQLVWQELDQVGSLAPETRATLERNGLRVGQAGSHPPPTLQKLLGLKEQLVEADREDRQMMRGRRLGLKSAQDSEIQTQDAVRDCQIRYLVGDREELVDYTDSRPVLKIRPIRVQDGWIRLEMQPEIHHGMSRMRHTPTDEGWALRGGQKSDSRHALQFQAMLNNGEMVVISGDPERPESLGSRMFCTEVEGRKSLRMLVIRLANSGKSESDQLLK